jgi:hypothetical protein
MDAKLNSLIQRLEAATLKLEGLAAGSSVNSTTLTPSGTNHPALAQFDALVSGIVKSFLEKSAHIGGLVQEQVI